MNLAVKNGNPKSCSVLATFVFVSALFGLFFSNAEGVTLLPFPDRTHERGGSFGHERSKNPYNQSLTSARSLQSKRSPSKVPTDDRAGLPELLLLQPSRAVTPGSGEGFDRRPLLCLGRTARNRPGRGPPSA